MDIAVFATTGFYPINIGGPGNVGYFLVREFGKAEHNITVFIKLKNKKELILLKSPEFKDLINVKIIPIVIEYNFRTFLNIPFLFFLIISFTYYFIRQKYDVVLYNSPPVDITLLIPLIAKLMKTKQFLILHGGLFNESKNYIGRTLIRIQINYFKKILAISNYSEEIAKRVGAKVDNIAIINNGIDLYKYSNLEKLTIDGNPKFLYVGRLVKIKAVDILIKAFEIVHKQLPNSKLHIIGDGSERDKLIILAKKLGIYENINFVGFIPPSENLYRYYITCHILILPSYIENFPITLLEAMYFKVPIIATRVGGITEIIKDHINGLLVEPGNYIHLAKNIIKLNQNKGMQKKFIEYNIAQIQEKYTWHVISKKYIDLFASK